MWSVVGQVLGGIVIGIDEEDLVVVVVVVYCFVVGVF